MRAGYGCGRVVGGDVVVGVGGGELDVVVTTGVVVVPDEIAVAHWTSTEPV